MSIIQTSWKGKQWTYQIELKEVKNDKYKTITNKTLMIKKTILTQ